MSVVKINAIEVPEGRGGALEERFAARLGEVEKQPGFLGFELLRPTAGESRYFVYTRWESEEAFQGWLQSSAFTRGHADRSGHGGGQQPVGTGSSLLEFEVVLAAGPGGGA
ncbi:MAG: antibiotic biosynthesis monooxygenase [Thermoleophilia bacterium]